SRLVPYKGQQVTMGVRPEDLHPASGSDPREYCFDAVVDVVEPLGSEILLDLRVGNNTIVARVEPTNRVKVHESTRLALTPDLSPLKDGPAAFVGLENYRRFLADPEFWRAATVTVVYAAVTSVAKLSLGVGFALLLARPFRGRALVFLAIFLPWAYPASVSVIGWYWTLSPPIPTAYSAFMGHLKVTVDHAVGTGAWSFVAVTLFNVWLLTAGRVVFPVIGTQAYWLAIKAGEFGPASALSLMLVPFLLAVLALLFRAFDPPDEARA